LKASTVFRVSTPLARAMFAKAPVVDLRRRK
jgi:hypothetical protein